MIYQDKITFEEVRDINALPGFHEILDCKCGRCGNVFRIPVPSEYEDWKKVAKYYQQAYECMIKEFSRILQEMSEQFQVPLVEYVDLERELLIQQLNQWLSERKEGAHYDEDEAK